MKSIKTKFIILIMMVVIVVSVVTGGVAIYGFEKAADRDSVEIINTSCGEKTQELNSYLERIEHSVEMMSFYATENMKSVNEFIRSPKFGESYTLSLAKVGVAAADETDGAVAVYMRFNPNLVGNKGYFRVYDKEQNVFKDYPLTDVTQYKYNDIGHAGWYYIPVKSGKPTWMEPYHNDNTDMDIISYVIPFYKERKLIGVVGMDIDINSFREKIDEITMYDTGHAFITDSEFNVIYDKDSEPGTSLRNLSDELALAADDEIADSGRIFQYSYNGQDRRLSVRKLRNGMNLVVSVPVSEINENINTFIIRTVIVFALILTIFIVVTVVVTKSIVRPLSELSVAAQQVAEGNLDVKLSCKSKDEVGMLSKNFKITVEQLKKHIDYINGLAYTDKLTGMNNNTSYMQAVTEIKEKMQNDGFRFTVFVVDINGLKHVNDTYGHSCGNELIIAASKAVTDVFGYENCYRIGGDEFAIIVEGIDNNRCDELENIFYETIEKGSGCVTVCAALGRSEYYGAAGETYESVFERADAQMYKVKEKMKAEGKNSSVEG